MLENDNKLLWSPSKDQIESSSMFLFMKMVNCQQKVNITIITNMGIGLTIV